MKQRDESTFRTVVGWATLVAMIFALWWWVMPPQFGGRTIFLTTKGISMEPLLHDGDLAVLHKQRTYKVGDIVQYHSSALNAPVLHRIVATTPTGYDTKGDNNNFVDLDHPTAKEINGKMVHRYTGMGKHLGVLKSLPARVIGATLVGLAAYFALTRRNPEKKKRRLTKAPSYGAIRNDNSTVTPNRASDIGSAPSQSGDNIEPDLSIRSRFDRLRRRSSAALMTVGAIIASISFIFAFAAYSHPASSAKDQFVIYNMNGAFNYSAQATGGDLVYRNGQVQTGDTVYLSMVNDLFVTFTAQIDTLGSYKGGGTIGLSADLKGASGWTHPLTLTPAQPFSGNTARTSAVIDLSQIRDIVKQINALTKVPESNYTLSLKPDVAVNGTIGGQKLSDTLASKVDFAVSGNTLKPVAAPASNDTADSTGPTGLNASKQDKLTGLNTSKSGQIDIPAGAPRALKTMGVELGVITLRVLSTGGVLIGLGLVGLGILGRRRERSALPLDAKYENSLKQYSDLFVPVAGWGQVGSGSMIIDVPSLDDLARVAESHNCLILQEVSETGDDVFVVNHQHLTYRYQFKPLEQAEKRFGAQPESRASAEESMAE